MPPNTEAPSYDDELLHGLSQAGKEGDYARRIDEPSDTADGEHGGDK